MTWSLIVIVVALIALFLIVINEATLILRAMRRVGGVQIYDSVLADDPEFIRDLEEAIKSSYARTFKRIG